MSLVCTLCSPSRSCTQTQVCTATKKWIHSHQVHNDFTVFTFFVTRTISGAVARLLLFFLCAIHWTKCAREVFSTSPVFFYIFLSLDRIWQREIIARYFRGVSSRSKWMQACPIKVAGNGATAPSPHPYFWPNLASLWVGCPCRTVSSWCWWRWKHVFQQGSWDH